MESASASEIETVRVNGKIVRDKFFVLVEALEKFVSEIAEYRGNRVTRPTLISYRTLSKQIQTGTLRSRKMPPQLQVAP